MCKYSNDIPKLRRDRGYTVQVITMLCGDIGVVLMFIVSYW